MANPDLTKPVRRFFRLLQAERRAITNIYIYALFNGLLTLSIPLGIQAIINFIQSGRSTTSWGVLVILVLSGLTLAGIFQIYQLTVAERIQQRLFVRSSIDFAYRIPRLRLGALRANYPPELINRFFDVMTVQKGLYKLLFDFSVATLQILFGLILLSLYHPFFIAFGFFIAALVLFLFRITSRRGLETSLQESTQKYKAVSWLEELARSLSSFKMSGGTELPLERINGHNLNYLKARREHFKILVRQYSILIVFKVLIAGSLLLLGGALVFERQMNIGQFVAAEIVIVQIINSVEKLVYSIETIYDVFTGVEKLGNVTDLGLEDHDREGFTAEDLDKEGPISVELDKVSVRSHIWDEPVLRELSFSVGPGDKVGIVGTTGAGKSVLLQLIAGLHEEFEGSLSFNGWRYSNIKPDSLRRLTGDNLQAEDLFEGTLLENISMGREDISTQDVHEALETLDMGRFVKDLQHGIHTELPASGIGLSSGIRRRIIMARSLVGGHRLMLLEDNWGYLSDEIREIWLDRIIKNPAHTLVLVSNDRDILQRLDRIYHLENGRILRSGSYEALKDDLPC